MYFHFMHGRIFEYMLYTFVFHGFFELLQKEDFFLCKPDFLSIMRVKGSLLFLKKNVDYHSDDYRYA